MLGAQVLRQLLDLAKFGIAYAGEPLHVNLQITQFKWQRDGAEDTNRGAVRRCLARLDAGAVPPDPDTFELGTLAMDVADQLKETGEVSRGWLGVLIQEVDRDLAESFGLDKPMGALVAQVQSGSPAAEAGLQPGDVIIAFNGREIQRSAQLPKWVGALKAGTEAEMTVVRDGDEKTLEVTVGELPDNPQAGMAGQPDQDQGESDKLGLEVRAASAAELARVKADHGVVITGVQDGPAARAGLSSGDLLVSLNGKPVDSLDAYREIWPALKRQLRYEDFFVKRELPGSARPYREDLHEQALSVPAE